MKPVIIPLMMWVLVGSPVALAATKDYSTTFDGNEGPLSEGGAWKHRGLDWTTVVKADGLAYGTQDGLGGYDDSYAYLGGFDPDQSATATIHTTPGMTGYHEVELLLRWSDSAHSATGYECTLSYWGQAYIVRWNGPVGEFTTLADVDTPVPQEGDVFKASVAGNVITLSLNGTEIARATDFTYVTGNPGIGFFRSADDSSSDYAFTNFSAHSSSPAVASSGGCHRSGC